MTHMSANDRRELARRYAERMAAPLHLTPEDQEQVAALLAPERARASAVELVLRKHLPVLVDDGCPVLCICDVTRDYEGPVGQRLHVADELRKAGLLRDAT